ncbi:hypothetical protein [Cypionkella sp.]|nr:hypothetical protein [Cypionkella sp.]
MPVKLGLIFGSGHGNMAQAVGDVAIPRLIWRYFRISGLPAATPIS